ncbi:MAG: hypothetical protein HFF39_01935 [Lawsonibacter sp.]|nr:hypothetical protein [Lawsonibacter sp.]
MKSILREQRRSSTLAALSTVVLGLALALWPDRSVSLMCALLGAVLLVCGLFYLIGWFADKRKSGSPAFMLIPGVVLAGLGIWLMTSAESVVTLIQYVFGAVILFHGVLDLQAAFSLTRQRFRWWWADLLLALVTLLLGLVILINPFGTFAALVTLIGCSLIYDGISDLWLIFRLGRAFRDLERAANGDIIETDGREIR